jgi:hypothetical protein
MLDGTRRRASKHVEAVRLYPSTPKTLDVFQDGGVFLFPLVVASQLRAKAAGALFLLFSS